MIGLLAILLALATVALVVSAWVLRAVLEVLADHDYDPSHEQCLTRGFVETSAP